MLTHTVALQVAWPHVMKWELWKEQPTAMGTSKAPQLIPHTKHAQTPSASMHCHDTPVAPRGTAGGSQEYTMHTKHLNAPLTTGPKHRRD